MSFLHSICLPCRTPPPTTTETFNTPAKSLQLELGQQQKQRQQHQRQHHHHHHHHPHTPAPAATATAATALCSSNVLNATVQPKRSLTMTRSRTEVAESSTEKPESQLRLTLKASEGVKPKSSLRKLGFSLHKKAFSMGNSNGKQVNFSDEVRLSHFKLLRVVGKGAFGKVRIVERKDTGLTFALKYIRKDEVVRSENVRNILRERRMLEHLNHPFLCNLRYSFQDYEYMYLVSDLMTGGDLRFHISRKTFTEDCIRFWIAELACALRYIHGQGVVHRDVKPDNILLDTEGHVHLADFNVASDYQPHKPLTSKSGTLAYLAPEVYAGKGYTCHVDWWSLGVVFYECIYSRRPFESSTHEGLANKIKNAEPLYPNTYPRVSTQCSSAMRSLIEKNTADRIGANGFDKFAQHPFFLPFDFVKLEDKEIQPIFVPSSDKTNFDATYDLEELLLEEAPLEARAKHQKPRPQLKANATPQERRAAELYESLERLFLPFDYTKAKFEKAPEGAANPPIPGVEPDTTLPLEATSNLPAHSSKKHRKPTITAPQSKNQSSTPHSSGAGTIDTSSSMTVLNDTSASPNSPLEKRDYSEELLQQQPVLSKQTSPNVTPLSSSRPRASRSVSAGNAQTMSVATIASTKATAHEMHSKKKRPVRTATSADPPPDEIPHIKKGVFRGLIGRRSRAVSPRRIENGILGKEGARVVQSWT